MDENERRALRKEEPWEGKGETKGRSVRGGFKTETEVSQFGSRKVRTEEKGDICANLLSLPKRTRDLQ